MTAQRGAMPFVFLPRWRLSGGELLRGALSLKSAGPEQ